MIIWHMASTIPKTPIPIIQEATVPEALLGTPSRNYVIHTSPIIRSTRASLNPTIPGVIMYVDHFGPLMP